MSFKINEYDPSGPAYAPRIGHDDWEKHRAIISHLHSRKTPRKVMLKRLRDEYDFTPTLGQLQAKCKEWDLKVYTKDGNLGKRPAVEQHSLSRRPKAISKTSSDAFHLATESGFVEEWSDDYRIHTSGPSNVRAHDRSLPPEYIGGGLLANTADSHWPLPLNDAQCDTLLQAAHFYHAIHCYQQSFSIYRAVYLYQRRRHSICDEALITTILRCACSAVTDHQRNIMHSVLCELGASPEFDNLNPLVLDCLQAASLNMISSDISCDIESVDLTKARSSAYFQIFSQAQTAASDGATTTDIQALLYRFEHALLMLEHEKHVLQKLLAWCDMSIERLQREVDDIFVGYTSCDDEYHRRVSQVLSGYLVSQWYKPVDDQDDDRLWLMQPIADASNTVPLYSSTTQTLVALAFVIVDAVRHDPLLTQFNKIDDTSARMWFLDAAKLFKRGIKMLCRLDDRSRCAVFSDAFLERFYMPVSYRQKAYQYSAQLPAIVDTIGMTLAQGPIWHEHKNPIFCEEFPQVTSGPATFLFDEHLPPEVDVSPPELDMDIASQHDPPPMLQASSPKSDTNSIASFMSTYHRTLKQKFNHLSMKSGRSTPGDVMSLTSSTEFKFGIVTNCNVSSAEVDSLWQMINTNDGQSSAG